MRHLMRRNKLGRKSKHREATLVALATSLIVRDRITTTLAKAKAVKPFAEKLVTLGKKGSAHHRRLAISRLQGDETAAKKLFDDVSPRFTTRAGGYTRILKLGRRDSDSAELALIEWTDASKAEAAAPATAEKAEKKPAVKKAPAKKAAKSAKE